MEVVESYDTSASINAMRKFVNHRGYPSEMHSDNRTFCGATLELKEFVFKLDKEAVNNWATNNWATSLQIVWHFNPPKAPHMGGVWERLVRSVKEVMTGLMHDHVLTDPQLYMFLTKNTVNSRPLTHVNNMEALTPNHILLASISNTDERDITSPKQWWQV